MKAMPHKLFFCILLTTAGLILVVAGCSGPGRTMTDEERADLEHYLENINLYEDFDETDYIDPPPATGSVVDHDVPPELMAGSASSDAMSYQTMQGFRVQVHSSLDKEGAVSAEEKVIEWWKTLPEAETSSGLGGSTMPVYLKFVQPYYRVRVGNFATREEAEVALQVISSRFPRAFIVVDRVTVLR